MSSDASTDGSDEPKTDHASDYETANLNEATLDHGATDDWFENSDEQQAPPPPHELSAADTASIRLDNHTELLQQMAEQISELHRMLADQTSKPEPAASEPATSSGTDYPLAVLVRDGDTPTNQISDHELQDLRSEIDEISAHVSSVEAENDDLRQQNADLASRLASQNVRSTVSNAQSSTSDALSWEERKALILQQLEDDDFDADTFIEDLQAEHNVDDAALAESPIEFVRAIYAQLAKHEAELANRDTEIGELHCLLDQRSDAGDGATAVGAAAIAQLIDSDELVMQERERLQLLQAEWEEKFRKSEIEASLERAKLSRERQELTRRTSQLEEQLEHARRECRQNQEAGTTPSRRWMAKLGISEKD
ncbi:hypothetical protein [Rubripirellula lacrimiformis]|nr:hypothetical protein [Rubripirellula lacrimiformis]